jgi:hypothetical protein
MSGREGDEIAESLSVRQRVMIQEFECQQGCQRHLEI